MGAQRAQMKGIFPGCFVGPVQETFNLPWLLWSAQHKLVFSHRTLFQIMSPHRPAIWAGSRARPPVSEYEAEGSKGEYVRSKELSCRLDK